MARSVCSLGLHEGGHDSRSPKGRVDHRDVFGAIHHAVTRHARTHALTYAHTLASMFPMMRTWSHVCCAAPSPRAAPRSPRRLSRSLLPVVLSGRFSLAQAANQPGHRVDGRHMRRVDRQAGLEEEEEWQAAPTAEPDTSRRGGTSSAIDATAAAAAAAAAAFSGCRQRMT